jgi:hypothetical protein
LKRHAMGQNACRLRTHRPLCAPAGARFSSSGAIDGIENWIEFLDALKVQIEKFLRARLGLGKQPFRLHDRQIFRSSNRHPSPRNFSYFTERFRHPSSGWHSGAANGDFTLGLPKLRSISALKSAPRIRYGRQARPYRVRRPHSAQFE